MDLEPAFPHLTESAFELDVGKAPIDNHPATSDLLLGGSAGSQVDSGINASDQKLVDAELRNQGTAEWHVLLI